MQGIFIYMWLDFYGIHVGKYTIIDPLGPGILTPICCPIISWATAGSRPTRVFFLHRQFSQPG